jgi:hypothetical protein
MAKFKSPFTTNGLSISQTYHGESASNPNDLSLQCAIDLSKSASSNVLSVCDGTVDIVTTSYGGYVSVIPDGASFKIFYVHVDRFEVSKGQRVKTGQILGKIKYLASGSHLHFALKNLSGRAPHPQPMDYFDRGLLFTTKYADIKAIWFTGGNLNWSKFKDLSYNSISMKIGDNVELSADTNLRVGSGTGYNVKTVVRKGAVGNVIGGARVADGYEWWDIRFLNDQGWMANPGGVRFVKTTKGVTQTDGGVPAVVEPTPEPPVTVPELTECQKEVADLKEQIEGLRTDLGALESESKKKDDRIKGLEGELIEEGVKYIQLSKEKERIEGERNHFEEENSVLKKKLEDSQTSFIKKITDALGEFLAKILNKDE